MPENRQRWRRKQPGRPESCSVTKVKHPLRPDEPSQVVDSDVNRTAIDDQNMAAGLCFPFSQPFCSCNKKAQNLAGKMSGSDIGENPGRAPRPPTPDQTLQDSLPVGWAGTRGGGGNTQQAQRRDKMNRTRLQTHPKRGIWQNMSHLGTEVSF